MEHYYNVHLDWKTDRKGEISSPELDQTIEVATPPQFPKGVERVWSPEHLFTAAISSCFMTTFLAIAENSNLEFGEFSCPAKGKLEKVDGKFIISEVILEPKLTISNDEAKEKAERILVKAEKACLITNSVKTTVILKTHIRVADFLV